MSEIDLWSATVTQAADDLAVEEYSSVAFNAAHAFFFSGGEWKQSRREIADHLQLHPDDLTRLGNAVRMQRYAVDGGPPPVKRPVRRTLPSEDAPPPPAPPPPAPVPYTPPVVRGPPPKPTRKPRPPRDRNWWIQRFLAKQAA